MNDLSAGGLSELPPGSVDQWEDAVHVWDQRFCPRVYEQAGWYKSLSWDLTKQVTRIRQKNLIIFWKLTKLVQKMFLFDQKKTVVQYFSYDEIIN